MFEQLVGDLHGVFDQEAGRGFLVEGKRLSPRRQCGASTNDGAPEVVLAFLKSSAETRQSPSSFSPSAHVAADNLCRL